MRYNVSKLLTNFIEITEKKNIKQAKFRKKSVNNKMEATI